MFTGIIKETGEIKQIRALDGGLEFDVGCSFAEDTHIDESISLNGVCQTVTSHSDIFFTVQAVEETLRKTNLGDLKQGNMVNLERSLTLNTPIEGHIVQGHVDTAADIKSFRKEGTNWLLKVELPADYRNHIVGRGSIAIDGISLTVARDEGDSFTTAIIPYTYEHTNLKQKKAGNTVNIEFDILGKYVLKFLSNSGEEESTGSSLSPESLKKMGY